MITIPYLLVRHKVLDYDKWKPAFDGHSSVRRAAGIRGGRLFRNPRDEEEVVLLFDTDDIEKAVEFIKSQDLMNTMRGAGVVDIPDMLVLEEVEVFSDMPEPSIPQAI